MSKKEYNSGRVKPLIQIIARLVQVDPSLADNMPKLLSRLENSIPSLKSKEKCANCGASMVEYIFNFDVLDAVLILQMANKVRSRLKKGEYFTASNIIHVPTLDVTNAVRQRTTRCSKLGLIAKYKNEEGRHGKGEWVITRRGWAAIRGEMVKSSVKVWRNKIVDHGNEKVNIYALFNRHNDKVDEDLFNEKKPKHDYRSVGAKYNADEWVHFGDTHNGKLI